jgi:hypothetical protein
MVWKTQENAHRKDGVLLMFEYIKFWLAKDIAGLIVIMPIIAIGVIGCLIYLKFWDNE